MSLPGTDWELQASGNHHERNRPSVSSEDDSDYLPRGGGAAAPAPAATGRGRRGRNGSESEPSSPTSPFNWVVGRIAGAGRRDPSRQYGAGSTAAAAEDSASFGEAGLASLRVQDGSSRSASSLALAAKGSRFGKGEPALQVRLLFSPEVCFYEPLCLE